MDYPGMEVGHVEEIVEDIEESQEEEEEIIMAPEDSASPEPAQQYVLIKSGQNVTRALRVQPGPASKPVAGGGIQYIKTESGAIVQILNASNAEPTQQFVQQQRVINTPKQIVIKGSGGHQYVVTNHQNRVAPVQVSQPTVTKKAMTMTQAQQMVLLKSGTSSAGSRVVTLNPTIRKEQPTPVKPVATPPQRVFKVAPATSQSSIKLKPVTGDSPRVIQISSGGGTQLKGTATQIIRPRANPEPNVQYVELVQSPPSEGSPAGIRVVKAQPASEASALPTWAFKNKYYNSSVGQKTVMIQQRSAQKAQEEHQEQETKWKVSRTTADALVKLEGSVVVPGVGTTKFVMLPTDYMEKLSSNNAKEQQSRPQHVQTVQQDQTNYSVIVDESDMAYQSSSPVPSALNESIKKRPCNCTKSQCLKLYCECFANGEFCSNCNCKECFNTMEYEDERQAAIYNCLERNPNAFRPKVGQVGSEVDVRHHKGCNCKRSGCLKNYCECFEAKVACSSVCKCVDCKNSDDNQHDLVHPTAAVGVPKPSRVPTKRVAVVDERPKNEDEESPPKQPYNLMTADVVDATVQCMMAQADECQQKGLGHEMTEMLILEEFGRCLAEIIDFSSKNSAE